MDNLERDLLNLKNKKIEVPKSVLDKINITLNQISESNSTIKNNIETNNIEYIKKEKMELSNEDTINKEDFKKFSLENRICSKKNNFNKKKYMAIAATISLFVLIGLTSPVRATINKMFFNNSGIENAVNNNYIQEVSNEELVTDDFNMKLNNILVDSSHISLEFELDVKNAKKLLNLNSEKNDFYSDIALYTKDGEVICEEGNVGMIGSTVYTFDNTKASEKKAYLRILFESTEGKIPKMDEINIKVKSLSFRNLTTDKIIYSSELNWDLNVNLDNKFTKTNDIQYSFKSESPNIVIHEAKAIPTGLFLRFDYLSSGHDENILGAMKVIDNNGKEYKMHGASMESLESGGDSLSGTFDGITSFDNIDEFILEIENPDGKTIDKVKFFK